MMTWLLTYDVLLWIKQNITFKVKYRAIIFHSGDLSSWLCFKYHLSIYYINILYYILLLILNSFYFKLSIFALGSIYSLNGTEVCVVEMATNNSECIRYIFHNKLPRTTNLKDERVSEYNNIYSVKVPFYIFIYLFYILFSGLFLWTE